MKLHRKMLRRIPGGLEAGRKEIFSLLRTSARVTGWSPDPSYDFSASLIRVWYPFPVLWDSALKRLRVDCGSDAVHV
jgi:hypothetical protein